MSAAKVSVIVPVRDAARYLRECLDSVLAQTVPPSEIVAVDDGSVDDSPAILLSYGRRVRRLALDGRGAAAARNAALAICTGEFVAFLDADDVWEPDRLASGLDAIESAPFAPLQYSDARLIDGQGLGPETYLHDKRPVRSDFASLLRGNYICTSTVLARRSALNEAGPFDESLRIAHDYALWLRLVRHVDCLQVARPLARYRVHSDSLGSDGILALAETLAVLGRWPGQPPRRRLFTLQYTLGRLLLGAGRFEEAQPAFRAALRQRPWDFRALGFTAAGLAGEGVSSALARMAALVRPILEKVRD